MTAQQIMSRPVRCVSENQTMADVAQLMLDHGVGCLPVVDAAGKMVGIVTESDFAAKDRGVPFSLYRHPQVFGQWLAPHHVERMYQAARRIPVREIMHRTVVAVAEDDTIEAVLRTMLRTGYHRIPVARDGVPVGVISRRNLITLMLGDLTQGVS